MEVTPTCPRCGYDLSGLVASWVRSCPMEATCAECGLEFDCGLALSPRLIGPPWSYEHTPEPRSDRFWRTSLWSLLPWVIWTKLRVDHQVRAARLWRFLWRWLAGVHFLLLTGTAAAWMLAMAGRPRGLGTELWLAGESALKNPWPLLRWAVTPYAHTAIFPSGAIYPLFPFFLVTYVPTALMPAWLAILGDSFRAARVRRVHLLRGLACSVPGAACWAFGLMALLPLVAWLATRWLPVGKAWGLALGSIALFFPIYHGVWWYVFIRWYLRLKHAAVVTVLLLITSALVVLNIVYLIWLFTRPY